MTLSITDPTPALEELVDPGAELRVLGTGFQFTEGPAWSPVAGDLVFSDIPGDTRWRWSDEGGMRVDHQPNNKGNGMVYDRDGGLLVCEHATSCLVRYDAAGDRQIVADHYRGVELNSPNDVVTRSDGTIYFSDPDYGRRDRPSGVARDPSPLGFCGVYRIDPGGGDPVLVVEEGEFAQPNGLCFSPDETVLYIDDLPGIKAFDVAPDGSLGPARVLRDGMDATSGPGRGTPDGMRCDELGNVWCAGPGGLWVLSPAGQLLGIIQVPEVCANLVWGGPDLHVLFLTASTTVQALPTRVGPAPLPYHREG